MPGWLDSGDVLQYLGIAAADTVDRVTVDQACAAVEPFVERCRPDAWTDPDAPSRVGVGPPAEPADKPAPDAYRGAVQLAGRLYQRRNSAVGVAAFNELGGPVYVARYDPDISWLLRLTRPRVG